MRTTHLLAFSAVLLLFGQQAAFAGAPLKGVDVKLGKNPGGSAAARLTDASGNADFGIWPKGDYTISVAAVSGAPDLHLVIAGPLAGTLERDLPAGASARAAPVTFSLGGGTPLRVTVTKRDCAGRCPDRPASPGNTTSN
ncbi:MAG TPA: hypothetical protein VJP88_08910 [Caulobacteraceae bacterium]|nr:hypothetical protein [Caulobacteraceae bacterium]